MNRFGLWDATAVYIGVILGSGIFFAPAGVAAAAPSLLGGSLLWLVGGGIAACGALTYAECAVRLPHNGGFYVYYREAYGPAVAFVGGWAALFITYPASVAVLGLILAQYAPAVWPALEGYETLVAAGAVIAATLPNIFGLRLSGLSQRLLTTAKVLAIAGILLAALFSGSTGTAAPPLLSVDPVAAVGALVAILWSYSGWSDMTLLAGDIERPAHTITRVVLFGTTTLVLLYTLSQVAVVHVLGPQAAALSTRVVADTVAVAFGAASGGLIAVLVMLSTFGAMSATILAVGRLGEAMALDGVIPRACAVRDQRFQTPLRALLAIAATSLVYVASESFRNLLGFFTFSVWIFYATTAVALYRLRRRSVGAPLAWRAPVWAPLVLIGSALVVDTGLLLDATQRGLALRGALLLLLGLPAYALWRMAADKVRGSY